MAKTQYWLMKCEPDAFSFDDLWRAKGKKTPWDGVRNHQARNFMRDQMRIGDGVLYYHSNAQPPGVAGIARVASEAYPDPTQFDPADGHYDPKSDPDQPRWWLVDVQALERIPALIPLADLRANRKLERMALLRPGQRLSVQPVSAAEWRAVRAMAGLK